MAPEEKKDVFELEDPLESKTMPKATLPPEVGPGELYRERMPTVVDDQALEEARQASLVRSSIPPKRASHDAIPVDELTKLRMRLAPLDRVPRLTRTVAELGSLVEDPKTAYILSFVDGVLPLETIVDVVGLPEVEVLKLVDRLLVENAIVFSTPLHSKA